MVSEGGYDARADFLVEAREILDRLGEQVVALEQDPDDRATLDAVFRGFHTIKGGAGFLDLPPMVALCHAFEDGISRYEHADQEHHDHLIDVETGAVIEFSSDAIEELQRRIAAELGYELVRHRLELYGRKKQPARKGRK